MSRTNSFISTIKNSHQAKELIEQLKQRHPTVTMRVDNYHYEFRHHRKHHMRYQKVVSSTHTREFRYVEYFDKSSDPNSVSHMKNYNLTRLDLGLNIEYSAQAS